MIRLFALFHPLRTWKHCKIRHLQVKKQIALQSQGRKAQRYDFGQLNYEQLVSQSFSQRIQFAAKWNSRSLQIKIARNEALSPGGPGFGCFFLAEWCLKTVGIAQRNLRRAFLRNEVWNEIIFTKLGRGRGTFGKCTGPKWSKRPFWSKWPYSELDFSIRETKMDQNGPFWSILAWRGPFWSI